MSLVEREEEFEKYRLTVEVYDEYTYQLVHDSITGEDTWQKWQRKRQLGYGAFGEVWQEGREDQNGDWHYRAVKTCSEVKMGAARIDYKRELSALAAFSKSECAAWFVNLHGWWMNSGDLVVAMEYLGRGDLSQYAPNGIPDEEIREIAEDVLRGLEVMHRAGFAHRDIKPQNILVFQKRPEYPRWWVKIADFGISKQASMDSATALHTMVGTRPYCAPEILGFLEQHQETSAYSSKVDIWSLGCVLFNLGSRGQLAFSEYDLVRYCDGTIPFNPKRVPLHLSDEGQQLVKRLLLAKPLDRPSATEALQHSWLTKTQVTKPYKGSISSSSMPSSITQTTTNPFRRSPVHASPSSAPIPQYGQNFNSYLDSGISQTSSPVSLTKDGQDMQSFVGSGSSMNSPPSSAQHTAIEVYNHARTQVQMLQRLLEDTTTKDSGQSLQAFNKRQVADDFLAPSMTQESVVKVTAKSEAEAEEPLPRYSGSDDHSDDLASSARWIVPRKLFPNEQYLLDTWVKDKKKRLADASEGQTPLFLAAEKGKLDIAELMLRQEVDVKAVDVDGYTALHEAVKYAKLDMAKLLVANGADCHVRDTRYNRTLLHWACNRNVPHTSWSSSSKRIDPLKVVQWLVSEQGLDVHAKDTDEVTPIHLAAGDSDGQVVSWLVEQGAEFDLKDGNGRSPLHWAAAEGIEATPIYKWLVRRGADIHATDKLGKNLLHMAVRKEYRPFAISSDIQDWKDEIECLIAFGLSVEARTSSGRTVLHEAALRAKLEIVKWLVEEKGADVHAKDNEGNIPRYAALELSGSSNRKVAKYLYEKELGPRSRWSKMFGSK